MLAVLKYKRYFGFDPYPTKLGKCGFDTKFLPDLPCVTQLLSFLQTIDEDILDAMVIIVYHLMHRDYLKVCEP